MNWKRIEQILEAGKKGAKTRTGKFHIEDIQIVEEYAEPGYGPGPLALGNWNSVTKWNPETKKSKEVDNTPCRVATLLEKMGVELEWSDEWVLCEHCGRAFRSSGDSYSWQMFGLNDECGCWCGDCVSENADEHLADLEGWDTKCNTIDSIDPSDYGYVRLNLDFENGFHPGQNDNPKEIGAALRAAGIDKYLFNLDCSGQFDLNFSVYVHESESVAKAIKAIQGE